MSSLLSRFSRTDNSGVTRNPAAPERAADTATVAPAQPRLAALGPALHLGTLTTNAYHPGAQFGVFRAFQMLAATAVGLVILVAPMSAIAYAADTLNASANINQSTNWHDQPTHTHPRPAFDSAYTGR